jgi:hypothetical protein
MANNTATSSSATVPAEAKVQSSALVKDKLQSRMDDDQVKTVALQTQEELLPIEREFGEGGDHIVICGKNSIEIIGTVPPPFDSTRVDPTGNVLSGVVLRDGGTVKNQKTYPLFENIDYTSDAPTGKKTIFANTLYEIKSYETNIDAAAHLRLNAGGNVKIASSQQVDLVSAYNINLESSSVVLIKSTDISLTGNASFTGTVSVDGSIMTNGAIYAQGGFHAPSFNGPAVIDKTNGQELYGYAASGSIKLTLGKGNLTLSTPIKEGMTSLSVSGGTLEVTAVNSGVGEGSAALITVPTHRHYFKRLAGTLAGSVLDIQGTIAPSVNAK